MTTDTDFRAATEGDFADVQALLKRNGLPFDDLAPGAMRDFVVRRDANGRLLAAGGVERHGDAGLLRSIVVDESARGTGLGRIVTELLERGARANGLAALYLLTTTAADFFPRLGYRNFARTDVPASIAQSAEFASICPSSAVCMKKDLRRDA